MTSALIDLYNNILEYDNTKISIIIDDLNVPWFSGVDIARYLEYARPNNAIRHHINEYDMKKLFQLAKFANFIPSNAQPNMVYINEYGLYSLTMTSKKDNAIRFRDWIYREVLPSIRETGNYFSNKKEIEDLKMVNTKLRKKLKKSNKKVKILLNNQKGKKYLDGGYMYIVRPQGTKKLKLGKSLKLTKRIRTLNTSVPDDVDVLFELKARDPLAVEQCTKSIMKPYIYRKNKEYYKCSINKLREIMKTCASLIEKEYPDFKNSRIIYENDVEQFVDYTNGENDDTKILVQILVKHNEQTGGYTFQNKTDLYLYKKMKYRTKYLGLLVDITNNMLNQYDDHIY